MSAVSIDLFTNISRNVQQTDMLSVLDWPDQFYNRFALSPDEASEIIAMWGLALVLLSLNWVLQDFLTGPLRQQCPWMALALRLFKALHWVDMKNSCLTCLLVSCILLTQLISFRCSLWTAHAIHIEGSPLSSTANLLVLWNHIFIISIYF